MADGTQGTLNVKAVAQATGLSPDTLRAWERRYGLPRPHRSPGGHRLYAARDVEVLKWLAARQCEGMSIGLAVERWRQLEDEGYDPLLAGKVDEAPAIGERSRLDQLRQAWLAACLDFDEPRAEAMLAQAFALHSPETVCFGVLQKGLAEVGEGWYEGKVSVPQEHFATELAMRRLERLFGAATTPQRPGRILACCPPQEEHAFALLLAALTLRWHGWDVLFLGANVPLEELRETILQVRPTLIVLAAQRLYTAGRLLEAAWALREMGVPLAYGGRAFNHLPAARSRLPGYFLGESIARVPAAVEQIVSGAPTPPRAEVVGHRYRAALTHYRSRRPALEAAVWQQIEPFDLAHRHIVEANGELARVIVAGLIFGDMSLGTAEVAWVRQRILNTTIPVRALQYYLACYYEAAQALLDERGRPVVAWLGEVVGDGR